jgi:TolB protein
MKRRTAAALAVLAVPLLAACTTSPAGPGTAASSQPPSVPVSSASPTPSPSPSAGSVTGLPGWLYYVTSDGDLERLTATGPVRVLGDFAGYTAAVSPDGTAIAYYDRDDNLIVTDRDGGRPRTVLRGGVAEGFEPTWSPDSTRVLTAKPLHTVGVVTLASGTFTPLPTQVDGIHFLWSADGRHLGYATGVCQLGVAGPDGQGAHLAPVIGDPDPKVNPNHRRSCDPVSIAPDGSRMAVLLHDTRDLSDGDIGRSLPANAVIDMRTGASVALPVSGTVSGVLFRTDGAMLVRHTAGGTTYLTLLGADGTVLTRVTEPATVHGMTLFAYVS